MELSPDALEQELRNAASLWSYPAIPCTSLELRVETARPKRQVEADGVNAVVFRRSRWCRNERCGGTSTFPLRAAAMTTTYPSQVRPGSVTEADIELNAVSFSWSGGNGSKPLAPLRAVLLHELGHVLGFPDVCTENPCPAHEASSVMRSGTHATGLTAWDVSAVCATFPR